MTIAALAKRLAAERQRLPVDVPHARPGHRRRRGGRQRRRPAALRLGHDARLRARLPRGRRHGHGVLRRRPGGQECRRLRPVPADGRLARHAGRDHPGDADGQAAARDLGPAGLRPARFRRRREAPGRPGPHAGPARRRSSCWPVRPGSEDSLLGPLARSGSARASWSASKGRWPKWSGCSASSRRNGGRLGVAAAGDARGQRADPLVAAACRVPRRRRSGNGAAPLVVADPRAARRGRRTWSAACWRSTRPRPSRPMPATA